MLGKIATFGTTMVKSLRRKEFIKNVDPQFAKPCLKHAIIRQNAGQRKPVP